MTTPENKSITKKFAGSGITKTLLTPCRRIGLSRTKKTPHSLNKPVVLKGEVKTTPRKTAETAPTLAKKSLDFNTEKEDICSPKEKKRKFLDELQSNDLSKEISDDYGNSSKSSVAKNVACSSKKIYKSKEGSTVIKLGRFTTEDYLKDFADQSESDIFREDSLFAKEMCKTAVVSDNEGGVFNAQTNKIQIGTSKNLRKETNSKEHLENIKKENDKVRDTIKDSVCISKNKNVRRSLSTKKSSVELTKGMKKSHIPNANDLKLKKITVSLERLPNGDVKGKIKKEKDDLDLLDCSLTPKIPHMDSINENTLELTNIGCPQIHEDEFNDDLFTSSPETDKKQRENLLKLIQQVETEIRTKEDRLMKLKQAEVYKKKHSPEKLNDSSSVWMEGCRLSLGQLLIHLQEHGPMEMDTLVKKLGIPVNIVEKLELEKVMNIG